MYNRDPSLDGLTEHTDITENITFQQPRLRAVIKVNKTVRTLCPVRILFSQILSKNKRIDKKYSPSTKRWKMNMLRQINREWCKFHENTLTMWEIK